MNLRGDSITANQESGRYGKTIRWMILFPGCTTTLCADLFVQPTLVLKESHHSFEGRDNPGEDELYSLEAVADRLILESGFGLARGRSREYPEPNLFAQLTQEIGCCEIQLGLRHLELLEDSERDDEPGLGLAMHLPSGIQPCLEGNWSRGVLSWKSVWQPGCSCILTGSQWPPAWARGGTTGTPAISMMGPTTRRPACAGLGRLRLHQSADVRFTQLGRIGSAPRRPWRPGLVQNRFQDFLLRSSQPGHVSCAGAGPVLRIILCALC